jgi:hypothetical protein
MGDTVEIMETRPISKNKNWRLLKVVTKGPDLSVTAASHAAAEAAKAALETKP